MTPLILARECRLPDPRLHHHPTVWTVLLCRTCSSRFYAALAARRQRDARGLDDHDWDLRRARER